MKKVKPACEEVYGWLRANLGKKCLAPLTGTDARALKAAVMILDLYAYDRNPEVLKAFAAVVRRMQTKCWVFAYHAIAMVLDWSDRPVLWIACGFGRPEGFGRCEFEPRFLCDSSPTAVLDQDQAEEVGS